MRDTTQRLFELRKQKEERTTAANRAAQLERLKTALAENEQEALTFENTAIPAAYEAIKTEVAERYALCHGRTGLYSQPEKSARVNMACTKLVGLLDTLLQRKRQLEELRVRVFGLQQQVDGDVQRAKNGEQQ